MAQSTSTDSTPRRTTDEPTRNLAERAALVGVGATAEARDRVRGLAQQLVGRYGSRGAVEQQLRRSRREIEKDIRSFERRGTTARDHIEQEVRQARARLERQLRSAERRATRRREAVSGRFASVSHRVEGAVQAGVATGERFATMAKERVTPRS